MKILCDQNVPLATELFGAHGDIDFVDGRSLNSAQLAGANALIVRSVTPVNEALLSGSEIEFVGSCTIGTDHLDTDYLDREEIHWRHAPGCNAQSVVEYVTSALAALGSLEPGLQAAVIGCGHVGGAVYQELKRLGMQLKVYDPFLAADAYFGLTDLEDAMASDILCVHTPLTRSGSYPTHKMIGKAELSLLRKNAVLLSAGRGGVVQEDALSLVARERPDIRWVLDVWENEPQINPSTLELATIATPHIAGYSLEGRQNGSAQVYRAFCDYFGFVGIGKDQVARPIIENQNQPSTITEILLGVYDPKEDDQRMRQALLSSSASDMSCGAWFDRLRREYPERRERSAYRYKAGEIKESLTPEALRLAEALGFVFC